VKGIRANPFGGGRFRSNHGITRGGPDIRELEDVGTGSLYSPRKKKAYPAHQRERGILELLSGEEGSKHAWTHPETGDQVVPVDKGAATRLIGMSGEEGEGRT